MNLDGVNHVIASGHLLMLKPILLSLPCAALIASLPGLETQAAPQPSGITAARSQQVRVFFPKNSRADLGYVEPVLRQTSSSRVAQFALEQVITGPSNSEKRQGFVAPISFRGASNCGGDFTLAINSGVARVQFCRLVRSAGVGDDARILSSVTTTLRQFPSVRSVVVLDQSGNCLGDMSGENRCLRR